MTWAQRLKRVFGIETETCEHCGRKVEAAAAGSARAEAGVSAKGSGLPVRVVFTAPAVAGCAGGGRDSGLAALSNAGV